MTPPLNIPVRIANLERQSKFIHDKLDSLEREISELMKEYTELRPEIDDPLN